MADQSLRLERVITLPAGTLLQYGNDSRRSIYFYDANNNQQLDPADKKVVQEALDKNQLEFEVLKVSQAEIQRFGSEAGTTLRQVRQERKELRNLQVPAKTGQCFAPSAGNRAALGEQGAEFTFNPPLTLRTRRVDPEKFYSLFDLMNWPKKNPLDPARCFMARSLVARETVAGLALRSKELEITTGDLLSPPVLRAMGIENDERVDLAYQIVQGAKRVHIDLTPLPAR